MFVLDVERRGGGFVRRVTDDYCELGVPGEANWRQSWESIALMAVQPDTPSHDDHELTGTLGGDPFYEMANEITLMQDRLATRLCALTASAETVADKGRVDELQANIEGHLKAVSGLLNDQSSHVRRDWLRGVMKVPNPFADYTERKGPKD